LGGYVDGGCEGEIKDISIKVEDLLLNKCIIVFMERTITVSDDIYKELLRIRSNGAFQRFLVK